jgi:hypothetical protein
MADFESEQAALRERIEREQCRHVFLDPDGTWPPFVMIVIKAPTGVIYENQCRGTATEARFVEGYLVPLAGPRVNLDEGLIDAVALSAVFHRGKTCNWTWTGDRLPEERLNMLKKLVEGIPYWQSSSMLEHERKSLLFDEARVEELAEAWIPVLTPDGPGVLLSENCD